MSRFTPATARSAAAFTVLLALTACSTEGTAGPTAPGHPVTRVASAAVVAVLAPGAGPARGNDGDYAAWAVQGRGSRGAIIEVVAADGSSRRALAADLPVGDQTNPDWSPDGSTLAFGAGVGGQDDLWAVSVDGTGARTVFDCAGSCDYVDDPAWAPDGTTIAVCLMRTSGSKHLGSLVSVDVATGKARTLATFARKDFCAGPRWSPDGRSLVLEVVHRTGTDLDSDITGVTLSRVDLGRKHRRPTVVPLTDPARFAATADWNAAGDLIVYSALGAPGTVGPELYTMRPDGSGIRKITSVATGSGTAEEPSFDRDGKSVVFFNAAEPGLMRVELSTGEVTPAFETPTAGRHPRARPRQCS